ncbi:hypothetical protein MLD38_035905 [Melastoma candidum]|uniref:Uncharacterized protein n=1 Tax=Melastoma candidum TaxID=119954 RepID=A0ACB9LIK1_9MYRT|nr:hypothetical protein MLD38_035905 [Melastoma candidum]
MQVMRTTFFRQVQKLPPWVKNDRTAMCPSDEITEQLEDKPWSSTDGPNILPWTGLEFSNYPKVLSKCDIDANRTKDPHRLGALAGPDPRADQLHSHPITSRTSRGILSAEHKFLLYDITTNLLSVEAVKNFRKLRRLPLIRSGLSGYCMARAPGGSVGPGGKTGVRIVVVGDRGTGKSSLICTAATEVFPGNVPPVLPQTRLPEDTYPDRMPITIIDTSSRVEDSGKLGEELRRADAVLLTYACEHPETLDRLSTFWLPELRRLEVKVPVIVVGCKLDLRDELQQISLEQVMSPIMQQFREIETCIECSAYGQIQDV